MKKTLYMSMREYDIIYNHANDSEKAEVIQEVFKRNGMPTDIGGNYGIHVECYTQNEKE